jgi:hypothetical protein
MSASIDAIFGEFSLTVVLSTQYTRMVISYKRLGKLKALDIHLLSERNLKVIDALF